MAGRLAGKAAVITGGASGIGLGIARRFVAEGAHVALGDRNRLVGQAVSAFGRLDIGVNCAGLGTFAPLVDLEEKHWNLVLDVCLKGVYLSIKHEARRMIAQGNGGAIINIASINARQPAEGLSAYCAAKAGVEMLTRCAAMELGPHNIRVTGIGPGLVDTPLTTFQQRNPTLREEFLANIPLGRVGAVEDIAGAALFLASDDASWVTGDTLFVDGAELTKKYPEMLTRIRRGQGDA
jgi:NAD(P)-dependent dehydrogenase (short-subunit alcohol dehydrogenase family)